MESSDTFPDMYRAMCWTKCTNYMFVLILITEISEFTTKLKSTQDTDALAVNGAWRGTNKSKLLDELGWESLYHRRWYRRLTHFYKLKNSQSPLYLYHLIPPEHEVHYDLRTPRVYETQRGRTARFSNTYFQNCTHEWNLLDESIISLSSI